MDTGNYVKERELRMMGYFQRLNAAEDAIPKTSDRDEAIRRAETIARSRDEIAHEALREFADDVDMGVQFAVNLSNEYRDERVEIYERALKESSSDETRILARVNYATILAEMGEVTRAVELVKPLPNATMSKSVVLPVVLGWRDRDEAREAALESIKELSGQIAFLKRRFNIDDEPE